MKNRYRILRNPVLPSFYDVQIKKWWSPIWKRCSGGAMLGTLEAAEEFIKRHKKYGNGNVVIGNYEG
jgi:hypothetical protein